MHSFTSSICSVDDKCALDNMNYALFALETALCSVHHAVVICTTYFVTHIWDASMYPALYAPYALQCAFYPIAANVLYCHPFTWIGVAADEEAYGKD